MANATAAERFWSKVDKTEGCWFWKPPLTRYGYGQFSVGPAASRRMVKAHRFSYELERGAIPTGLQVDHICRNRACVRPDHLRLATNKQNHENLGEAFSDSKTGIRGVSYCKQTRKWLASVGHNGKAITVGRFKTIEDAEVAVIAKRNELFTYNDIDRAS